MDRQTTSGLKWLGGALLTLGLSGCITYTGEYVNDGYYSSPDRGNAYNNSYYGDYYYSAVPTINISYNLFFGYPFYGYGGCNYWSPYCSLFYPGYGYGPGYGFGWGHRPHYGHQNPPHHHKPKPKPANNHPGPPVNGGGQPIVHRPIRALPGNVIGGRPQQQSQPATQPVSTGSSSNQVVTAPPPEGNAAPKTTYWRIPVNQRQSAPVVRRDAPAQREDNLPDTEYGQNVEYVQVERTPRAGNYPIRISNPKPVNTPDAQDSQADIKPEKQERQAVREPKQARGVPVRKVSVDDDGEP